MRTSRLLSWDPMVLPEGLGPDTDLGGRARPGSGLLSIVALVTPGADCGLNGGGHSPESGVGLSTPPVRYELILALGSSD